MSKEKVTVVTQPGRVPRVYKTRKAGADVVHKETHRWGLFGDKARESFGRFIEQQSDIGRAGDFTVQEVPLEDE